jgi:serine/threonine-protein kinase
MIIDELAALKKSHKLLPSRGASDGAPVPPAHALTEPLPGTNQEVPSARLELPAVQHARIPPPRIGTYVVGAALDSTERSQVFQVFDPKLGRELVLHVYPGRVDDDPAARDRLRRAGRLLAECSHPNLLPIVDVDVHEGHPFVVMQRIYSLALMDYVEQRRPGPREAAGLVSELARAVNYLHSRGIVHPDLTPQSVLIDETGRPRLIDFGLARLRAAFSDDGCGATGSSISQTSREHPSGNDGTVEPGTDVRGLGGLLYHLLIGRMPDQRTLNMALLKRVKKPGRVRPRLFEPGVPHSLERICLKALALDPKWRYQTVAELERALRRFRARRWFAAIGSVVLAVLAVAFFTRS